MANRLFSAFLLLFLILSCAKEDTISLTYNLQQESQDYALEKIHFFNDTLGIAMGGDTYLYGIAQYTFDGGFNWSRDTVSKKIVRDFDVRGLDVLGSGVDSYILQNLNSTGWEELRTDFYESCNGIVKTESHYLLAGGIALKEGFILLVDNALQNQEKLEFIGELSSIEMSDESIIHAVGYGQVLRSEDGGLTWQENAQVGDFYQDVFFVNERTGWIVGESGSILKTENAGLDWLTIRKPNAVDKIRFNSIFFQNELDGYIVGDEGVIWTSDDGGVNWKVVSGIPIINYKSIFSLDNIAWACADNGQIIRLLR